MSDDDQIDGPEENDPDGGGDALASDALASDALTLDETDPAQAGNDLEDLDDLGPYGGDADMLAAGDGEIVIPIGDGEDGPDGAWGAASGRGRSWRGPRADGRSLRERVGDLRHLDRRQLVAMARRISPGRAALVLLCVISLAAGGLAFRSAQSGRDEARALRARVSTLSSELDDLSARIERERRERASGEAGEGSNEPAPPPVATPAQLAAIAGPLGVKAAQACAAPDKTVDPIADRDPMAQARAVISLAVPEATVARERASDVRLDTPDAVAALVSRTDDPAAALLGRAEGSDVTVRAAQDADGRIHVATAQRSAPLDAATLLELARVAASAAALPTDAEAGAPEKAERTGDAMLAAEAVHDGAAHLAALRVAMSGAIAWGDAAEAMQTLRREQIVGPDGFAAHAGLSAACAAVAAGGQRALDALLADPPVTTAALLASRRDITEPIAPRAPSPLAGSWERRSTRDFGAGELWSLLAAPGGDPDAAVPEAAVRAGEWAGGVIEVWRDGERSAAAVAITAAPGAERSLCRALQRWYRAAFSAERFTEAADGLVGAGFDHAGVVRCAGDQIRVGVGPDLRTAATVTR